MPVELGDRMLEARGTTEISRSPEEVFDYLADLRNEPLWLPGAADIRLTSDGKVGRGSTFEGTYARAGQVKCSISRHQRPGQLTIHGEGKGMTFDDEVTLTATTVGTRLDAVMWTQPKGLFKLFAPMMGRIIGKQFQGNWDNLKRVLES
jgi:carbon monoxide dehydrogenase subunit G